MGVIYIFHQEMNKTCSVMGVIDIFHLEMKLMSSTSHDRGNQLQEGYNKFRWDGGVSHGDACLTTLEAFYK